MTTATKHAGPATALWHIDPTHANVEFGVRHLMISTVRGRFAGIEGAARVADDDLSTADVEVTIDADSIDTRLEERDDHLRSEDFLDSGRFPTLTFRSTRVERVGEAELSVTGDLTIRGVTNEVVLDVHESGTVRDPWGGDRAGYSARAKIDRRDFGLTWNQTLETGGLLVGNEVTITIDVELLRQPE